MLLHDIIVLSGRKSSSGCDNYYNNYLLLKEKLNIMLPYHILSVVWIALYGRGGGGGGYSELILLQSCKCVLLCKSVCVCVCV